AVGHITRRAGSAIAIVLAVLYAPAIVSLMLADPIRGLVQRVSPMMAGLAVQRTVERVDSVPIGQLAGLAVAVAWATAAVLVAVWLVRRRDA
ncbi:MAG: ABC transporter permease, partial [Acidimicrobiia bacterium]